MNKLGVLLSIILSISLIACSQQETSKEGDSNNNKEETTYPNAELLVDTEWVVENLNDENVHFVDMRAEGYEGGHIPGAANITWPEIADPDNEFDGVLLPPEGFATKMQEIGINVNDTIVIYDDGSSLSAARLFYALEYYGHQDVKIYNGGFTAWLHSGNDVSTETPEIVVGDFEPTANEDLACDIGGIKEAIEDENIVILDTRSEGEYNGEDVRAERGGHVPNAVHIEWSEAITEVDGVPTFKSFEDLTELYESKGVTKDKTVIPYCQTNVRGAHTYFTLRLLGYDSIMPYEGSWAEYGNTPEAKIEK
ncbi:sulfurtransferase [Salirhabdus salicampi]|uniref:sulfurtransferase n=1 Tax=Salirhabdus salicampi TaxID=476102 RepID=UPI0020C2C448|nr:sulfurtransferase [Salirhabdus salicampi]MCP8616265.1 sulfurtransferase [Salirhabdus salicampi]